jgi:hypothetical protein
MHDEFATVSTLSNGNTTKYLRKALTYPEDR